MNTLFVFYDETCSFCQRCRRWVEQEPAYVRIEFRPLGSPVTRKDFPDLEKYEPGRDLVVFTDEGAVYRGTNAWILILWALRRWRPWSIRLAEPKWRPHVGRFWNWISRNRRDLLSTDAGFTDEVRLRRQLESAPQPGCGIEPQSGETKHE